MPKNFKHLLTNTIFHLIWSSTIIFGTKLTSRKKTQSSIEQIPEELHEFVENSRDILAARDLERGIKPIERHAQQYWDFGDELSR